jgi:hypothetical protein
MKKKGTAKHLEQASCTELTLDNKKVMPQTRAMK